jgi:hypothetical protein
MKIVKVGQDPRPVERITALIYAATRQASGGINALLPNDGEAGTAGRTGRSSTWRSNLSIRGWREPDLLTLA